VGSDTGERDEYLLPATGPWLGRGRRPLEEKGKGPIECNCLRDSARADYEGEGKYSGE